MELIKDNEGPYDGTDNNKLIDQTITNNPVKEKFDSGQVS
jgi:hypothetical protein